MRDNLAASLKLMFGDEGGYSNRSTDAGGPTKYGITHRTLASHRGVKSVTAAQVKRLTLAEAEEIYVKSYWGPSGGDALPTGLDYAAFDFGVNSGPMTAVKKLQRVLGVTQDGWIGPQTLAAVEKFPGGVVALIEAYCAERMRYLRSLKGKTGFASNGRGWTIRVTGVDPKGQWADVPGVVGNATAMATAKGAKKPALQPSPDPLPAGGDSKANPPTPNPWLKPEVILPGAGAAGTAVLPILGDSLVLQVALGVAVVIVIAVGAFFAFRRIKQMPVS